MSNIEIACRVRPFRRGEAQQNIEVRAKAVYSEGANCTLVIHMSTDLMLMRISEYMQKPFCRNTMQY